MSATPPPPPIGSVAWLDLTVPNAVELRDFYRDVVGWTATEVDMGGYADFGMLRPGSGDAVAGICHARGPNADMPAHWILYFAVADLDASIAACIARGGRVIVGPKSMGPMVRYCVIQDPAGAVAGLIASSGSAQPS